MKHPCKECPYAEHHPRGKTGKQHYHTCTKGGCEKKEKYHEYRISTRKYIQGEPIKSIEELLGEEMIYIFGVPRHIQYVKQLSIALILNQIRFGRVNKAIKKTEVINNGKE